jgi:nitrogenase subunit NifH
VHGEFTRGQHVEVGVDGVIVEGDEGIYPWVESSGGEDGRGGGSEAVVELCNVVEAGVVSNTL